MPGRPWTTIDQHEFLSSRLPQYLDAQSNGNLSSVFWPMLHRDWFDAYPERALLFPDDETLSPSQEEMLLAKLTDQRRVSV
jgi:hypothetical protein